MTPVQRLEEQQAAMHQDMGDKPCRSCASLTAEIQQVKEQLEFQCERADKRVEAYVRLNDAHEVAVIHGYALYLDGKPA